MRALEVAGQDNISSIMQEDSWQLEEAIRTSSRDIAPSGRLLRDIQKLLHDCFVCSNLLHVSRVCNSSAHELAQLGLRAKLEFKGKKNQETPITYCNPKILLFMKNLSHYVKKPYIHHVTTDASTKARLQ